MSSGRAVGPYRDNINTNSTNAVDPRFDGFEEQYADGELRQAKADAAEKAVM